MAGVNWSVTDQTNKTHLAGRDANYLCALKEIECITVCH